MDSLKVKVSFPAYISGFRGLVKLGKLSGEELALSSWWIKLAEKIVFSVITYLVVDMDADAKRSMRPKTLGPLSLFFCLF